MKNGTVFATRLKKFYTRLRQTIPKPELPDADDPVRRLAMAILGVGTSDEEGAQRREKLFAAFVDWNDLRVSRPLELCRALDDSSPETQQACQQLITSLNAIYRQENKTSLERLKSLGRREARQYLENLAGMDDHAVAAVFLWSLGGHAIPVSNPVWDVLRKNDLVDPHADRGEVQAFLERNISANDAKEFCVLIRTYAAQHRPAATRSKPASGRAMRRAAGEG